MKALLIATMLLVGALAPPPSHSAHCCATQHHRPFVRRQPRPVRVLRTPQAPKVVRAVGTPHA